MAVCLENRRLFRTPPVSTADNTAKSPRGHRKGRARLVQASFAPSTQQKDENMLVGVYRRSWMALPEPVQH